MYGARIKARYPKEKARCRDKSKREVHDPEDISPLFLTWLAWMFLFQAIQAIHVNKEVKCPLDHGLLVWTCRDNAPSLLDNAPYAQLI